MVPCSPWLLHGHRRGFSPSALSPACRQEEQESAEEEGQGLAAAETRGCCAGGGSRLSLGQEALQSPPGFRKKVCCLFQTISCTMSFPCSATKDPPFLFHVVSFPVHLNLDSTDLFYERVLPQNDSFPDVTIAPNSPLLQQQFPGRDCLGHVCPHCCSRAVGMPCPSRQSRPPPALLPRLPAAPSLLGVFQNPASPLCV